MFFSSDDHAVARRTLRLRARTVPMGSGWWIADLFQSGQYVRLVGWIFWVIFSICLHELAHGWAALRQGDETPRSMGHMTWNPLVHMGPMSLLIFAIVGIAWGLMPVTPSNFRDGRLGRAKVAAAGPAMNFGLAVVCIVFTAIFQVLAARAGNPAPGAMDNLAEFFFVGSLLNIVLGIFNLIPAPPLDGSQIAAGLSWKAWEWLQHPNAPMVGLAILALCFFSGFFGVLFRVAAFITNEGSGLLTGLFI